MADALGTVMGVERGSALVPVFSPPRAVASVVVGLLRACAGRGTRLSAGLAAAWARSERMVGRWVAGEFVVVPLRDRAADLDAIYNLSRVAAYIWERLDGRTPGQEVVRRSSNASR